MENCYVEQLCTHLILAAAVAIAVDQMQSATISVCIAGSPHTWVSHVNNVVWGLLTLLICGQL